MSDSTLNPQAVEKHGFLEVTCESMTTVGNPYIEISATAKLIAPNGATYTLPLYWDGGTTWRWRFSPREVGQWQWRVESNDTDLAGTSGEFHIVDSTNPGGISRMKSHPRHFQRQNGEPFWFMGDTAWALYTDNDAKQHDRKRAEYYIDTRAGQGFNVIHSMLISEAGWGNHQGDAFTDLGTEQINPAYWQEVDERLAYLNQQGIVGGLVLAWGNKGRNPNDWREFPSQEARLRYARYVTARYSAYDVYFVVAGEWNADLRHTPELTEEQARAEYAEIGRMIRQNDPHGRMIAMHPMSTGTVREFANEDWVDFADYQQMYPNLHTEILASRQIAYPVAKPVVNSEYAYYLRDQDEDGVVDKDNSFDIDTIRHATWDIVMAGGYFVTGFGSTYFGGYRHPGPFAVDVPQNDVWEEQIQHVKQLFTRLEWWRLQPADELIRVSVSRSTDRPLEREGWRRPLWRPPETTYWTLADEGQQYVIYTRGLSSALTLPASMNALESSQIQQFNPRTGEYTPAELARDDESLVYTPADSQDWVLVTM